MLLWPDPLAIRREVIGDRRRRRPCPRPVIAHIGPDPTLFHALAKAFDTPLAIKNPDMRVITMDTLTRHDTFTDPLNQRGQNPDAAPTPVGQRRIRDIRPHPLEDLIEAIERKVVVVFGDQDERQQARARHPARYRAARRRGLNDRLTAAAISRTDDLCDRQPGGDHVEHLAHVFALTGTGTYLPEEPFLELKLVVHSERCTNDGSRLHRHRHERPRDQKRRGISLTALPTLLVYQRAQRTSSACTRRGESSSEVAEYANETGKRLRETAGIMPVGLIWHHLQHAIGVARVDTDDRDLPFRQLVPKPDSQRAGLHADPLEAFIVYR
jgi:hypothetical protein